MAEVIIIQYGGRIIFIPVLSESPPTCYDGNVQLGDRFSGSTPEGYYQVGGRVEVCYNGTYGSVCGTGWDQNDAQVVCRYMGYYEGQYSEWI